MIREFGYNNVNNSSINNQSIPPSGIIIGRVTEIYLDKIDDENLGMIDIQDVAQENQLTLKAYPFFPNNTSYPLIDEIVLCFNLPSQYIGSQQANERLYYINSVNIWNNPHVNFFPSPKRTNGNIPATENRSYEDIFSTSFPKNLDSQDNTSLPSIQKTFKERDNIHPLQPYMGDVISQGRFGNSIRFGSTNQNPKDEKPSNNWSDYKGESKIFNTTVKAQTGDPILILRNGQPVVKRKLPKNGKFPWMPIDEQINWDLSSIYMTSNQQIEIETSGKWENLINSYKGTTAPANPKNYAGGPQVIIRSDRLVFNARQDSIILNAENSVHLSSNESLNFDTKKFSIDCSNIRLGTATASEPLILGNKFLFDLNQLLIGLSSLCTVLQTQQIWPAGAPVNDVPVNTAATALYGLITTMQGRIETYKSRNTFTK